MVASLTTNANTSSGQYQVPNTSSGQYQVPNTGYASDGGVILGYENTMSYNVGEPVAYSQAIGGPAYFVNQSGTDVVGYSNRTADITSLTKDGSEIDLCASEVSDNSDDTMNGTLVIAEDSYDDEEGGGGGDGGTTNVIGINGGGGDIRQIPIPIEANPDVDVSDPNSEHVTLAIKDKVVEIDDGNKPLVISSQANAVRADIPVVKAGVPCKRSTSTSTVKRENPSDTETDTEMSEEKGPQQKKGPQHKKKDLVKKGTRVKREHGDAVTIATRSSKKSQITTRKAATSKKVNHVKFSEQAAKKAKKEPKAKKLEPKPKKAAAGGSKTVGNKSSSSDAGSAKVMEVVNDNGDMKIIPVPDMRQKFVIENIGGVGAEAKPIKTVKISNVDGGAGDETDEDGDAGIIVHVTPELVAARNPLPVIDYAQVTGLERERFRYDMNADFNEAMQLYEP